jgi:hypothetical protein
LLYVTGCVSGSSFAFARAISQSRFPNNEYRFPADFIANSKIAGHVIVTIRRAMVIQGVLP